MAAKARGSPSEMGALMLTVIFVLVLPSGSFQITRQLASHRASSGRASPTSGQLYVSPYAFQQARLTEQLRLSGKRSKIPLQQQQTVEEGLSSEHGTAAEVGDRSEEARAMMATESEADSVGEIPFAPMMTYGKYLTMQVSSHAKHWSRGRLY